MTGSILARAQPHASRDPAQCHFGKRRILATIDAIASGSRCP